MRGEYKLKPLSILLSMLHLFLFQDADRLQPNPVMQKGQLINMQQQAQGVGDY